MITCPHKEKLLAAIQNRKASDDAELLKEAYSAYLRFASEDYR